MNPYALRTCAVGPSCHVFTDLKLNIVEFSVFRYTISWFITNYKFLVHYTGNLLMPGVSPRGAGEGEEVSIGAAGIDEKNDYRKFGFPMI